MDTVQDRVERRRAGEWGGDAESSVTCFPWKSLPIPEHVGEQKHQRQDPLIDSG